jgi:hypothetical protein
MGNQLIIFVKNSLQTTVTKKLLFKKQVLTIIRLGIFSI